MTGELEKLESPTGGRAGMPGGAFFVVHDLWRLADAETRAALPRAAADLGIPESELARIREFHRAVIERGADTPLILCRGVSCRLHGADEFHVALKADLEAAGALGATIDVHCLSQCPHGPNMKLGEHVLCTGKRAVVHDVRPWRPVTAGPKPLDTGLPPVP
jgi:NADH:ubiquinone oxidoreductase subunit E